MLLLVGLKNGPPHFLNIAYCFLQVFGYAWVRSPTGLYVTGCAEMGLLFSTGVRRSLVCAYLLNGHGAGGAGAADGRFAEFGYFDDDLAGAEVAVAAVAGID